MFGKILRATNSVSGLNLPVVPLVIFLAATVLSTACTQTSTGILIQNDWVVQLKDDGKYQRYKHPEKELSAGTLPDGLVMRFITAQGHSTGYTFPHEAFSLNEPALLLCPGSPANLPVRVVRLNKRNDYRIEWLAESPATSNGIRIVHSR